MRRFRTEILSFSKLPVVSLLAAYSTRPLPIRNNDWQQRNSHVAIRLRRVQNLPFSKVLDDGAARNRLAITRIYLLVSRILGPKRSSLKYRDRKDKRERASSLEAEYRATSDCLKELATEIWKLPVQKL
ncbi:hypothetical protein ACH5RR_003136 [Cinchona calisaya]|uniref:Uncharacterized protein n=1 Tax=Cinchona calisaya TaxID=153742 RepID=A0ABD3ATZ6_9GENT